MSEIGKQTHQNNFSILRMLFATLVISSHSYELVDGNRTQEVLTRIFGTISFGELAVDGFFIVSGYLITKSYLSSDIRSYLTKRILRIYLGFIVSFFVSVLLCQYFSSHSLLIPVGQIVLNVLNLFFLMEPDSQTAYPHSFYPLTNGAMWSISYEFHCYLMIVLLGFFGVFRKQKVLLGITVLFLAIYFIHPEKYAPYVPDSHAASVHRSDRIVMHILLMVKSVSLEAPLKDARLFGIFLAGSCFFIYRREIPYRTDFAAFAALLLTACMFSRHLAEPALAVFGGYLIFWFALRVEVFSMSRFFNKTDLSYGIYLYAWPIQKVLITQLPRITPTELSFATLIVCIILAYASWTLVEKPCLSMKSRFLPRDGKFIPTVENAR